jgi:hypothetical protein
MRSLFVSMMLLGVIAIACNEKETANYPRLNEYYSLAVGKTFIYRLDSIVPINFGQALQTRYYRAKDSVESQFTDALGRPSFRIYRYITDSGGTQPWVYKVTNVATIDDGNKWIEYVENNLRFVLLKEPISEGFSWKGNSFIDTKSGNSPVKYMDEWNYTYMDIHQPFTVRKGTFDTTISILQTDEVSPPGPHNPSFYQQTNYSKEVYAKGIGLIFKEFLHKTWDLSPGPHWVDDSYGVKLNLVDYK